MEENNTDVISLDSVDFLFRHPWVIVYSLVIVVNFVQAYVYGTPARYQCNAVLSFEMAGTTVADRQFLDAKKELVGKVLLGENINGLIKEVWPDLDDKKEPFKYNETLEQLRDPKTGIRLQQEEKVNPNLLTIMYQDSDPKLCYKVANATVSAVLRENSRESEEKSQASLVFLNKQLDVYKDKISNIEKETSDIKNDLLARFPELTERERDMVVGITGQTELMKKGTLETFVMYDERLTGLNLELLEAQKKKENLQKRLETGDVAPTGEAYRGPQDDLFIGEYSKAIAAKEVEIADLISRGYKKDHPQIKKIQAELDRLRLVRQQRITELKETGSQFFDREAAIERLKSNIGQLDFQIESIKSKIVMVEEYRRGARNQLRPEETGKEGLIAEKLRRLEELSKEKVINEGYYIDIRKQLEETELKSRLEKAKAGFTISIVEKPKMPVKPIPGQRIKMMLLALIISSMIGISFAYIIDSLDDSIRSSNELRKLLMTPVLATIDQISTPQEVMIKHIRRNAIIFTLACMVVVTRILVKILIAITTKA